MAPPLARAGFRCALLAVAFSVAYTLVMTAVIVSGTGIPPVAPYDTLISLISLSAAPLMVFLWTLVHRAAPERGKPLSLCSLAFVVVFAALTSINRYVSLTVVPAARGSGQTQGLEWFLPYGWPSVMSAIEMLAWGFWLGMAFVVLAPVFRGDRLERTLSAALLVTGALCLVGVLGQVTGRQGFTAAGVLGWGPGMMSTFVLLALWFRRASRDSGAEPAAEGLRRPAATGAGR